MTLAEFEPSVLPASQQSLSVGQLDVIQDVVGVVPVGERSTQLAPPSELSSKRPASTPDGGHAIVQQCCESGHEIGPTDLRPFGSDPNDHEAPPLIVRQTIEVVPSEDETKLLAIQNSVVGQLIAFVFMGLTKGSVVPWDVGAG
jgi:hypothetical protein